MAFGFGSIWFSRQRRLKNKLRCNRRRDLLKPRFESLEDRRLLDGGGIADPGFPFVDADNNGLYNADANDVLLIAGELDDGRFDAARSKRGTYDPPGRGAGLVIPASVVLPTLPVWQIRGGGNLVIRGDLTANRDIIFASREGSVVFDGAAINAGDDLNIVARTDITVKGGADVNIADDIKMASRCDIHVDDATISAGDKMSFIAGCDVVITGSSTLIDSGTAIVVNSRGGISVTDAHMNASQRLLKLSARTDIVAHSATLDVRNVDGEISLLGQLEIKTRGEIDLEGSAIAAGKTITIQAGDDVLLDGADIDAGDARTKRSVRIKSSEDVVGTARIIATQGHIEVLAKDSIQLDGSEILGGLLIHMNAGEQASVTNALLVSALPPGEEVGVNMKAGGGVIIKAKRDVDVHGTTIRAWDTHTRAKKPGKSGDHAVAIHLKSLSSDVIVTDSDLGILHGTTLADIRLDAHSTLFVEGAILTGPQAIIFLERGLVGEPASVTEGTVDPIYI